MHNTLLVYIMPCALKYAHHYVRGGARALFCR